MVRSLALALALALAVAGSACYEIPPDLAMIESERPPTPPRAYDPAAFAPENLWFTRAWLGERPADGQLSEPAPPGGRFTIDDYGEVDRAEMIAFLDAACARAADETSEADSLGRAMFHADVVSLLAARGETSSPASVSERATREAFGAALTEAARATAPHSSVLDSERALLPPPLRESGWRATERDLPRGLLPSGFDFRWTETLERSTEKAVESALVRYRIAWRGEIVATRLPSECWVLRRVNGGVEPSVWRVDRARLARGEDPWVEWDADATIEIRNPSSPELWVKGPMAAVCTQCHDGATPELGRPDAREDARLAAQVARAREIIAKLGERPAVAPETDAP